MTDAEINRCREGPGYWQFDCEACPDRARCDELARETGMELEEVES